MPAAASPSVRLARPGDLDAIDALERECFTLDAQSRRSLVYLLNWANAQMWVAEAGDRLLGDVIVLYRRGAQVARVYSIAVGSQARGQGLGTRLLAEAEKAAAQRGCCTLRAEARRSNAASRQLFLRAGYREGAMLPAYYPDGEDGIRLEKRLPG